MRTSTRRKLEAAHSALAFNHAHPDPTPAAGPSVTRLGELLGLVAELEEAQARCEQEANDARDQRDRHLEAIRTRTEDLVRLAGAVAMNENIPELTLRLPRDARDGRTRFFAEVRQTVTVARRQEDLLMRWGLPATLLGQIECDLLRYELADRQRVERESERAQATGRIEALPQETGQLIRHLDALNRIRFAGDSLAKKAWLSASAVRWTRREPVTIDTTAGATT